MIYIYIYILQQYNTYYVLYYCNKYTIKYKYLKTVCEQPPLTSSCLPTLRRRRRVHLKRSLRIRGRVNASLIILVCPLRRGLKARQTDFRQRAITTTYNNNVWIPCSTRSPTCRPGTPADSSILRGVSGTRHDE